MRNRMGFDVTFRGVGIDEVFMGYVRRCADRLRAAVPRLDEGISVTLERAESGAVLATVAVEGDRARGEDLDGLLALSNAFAALHDRMGRAGSPGSPRLRSGPATVEHSGAPQDRAPPATGRPRDDRAVNGPGLASGSPYDEHAQFRA